MKLSYIIISKPFSETFNQTAPSLKNLKALSLKFKTEGALDVKFINEFIASLSQLRSLEKLRLDFGNLEHEKKSLIQEKLKSLPNLHYYVV